MPLYDYKCAEHGVFQEMVKLADFDKPCACPQCGAQSPRVILFSPEFLAMAAQRRQAFETNEKARHEPVFSNQSIREDAQRELRQHKHAPGCGCHSEQKRKSSLMYTADGSKMFPSMRPWMISH